MFALFRLFGNALWHLLLIFPLQESHLHFGAGRLWGGGCGPQDFRRTRGCLVVASFYRSPGWKKGLTSGPHLTNYDAKSKYWSSDPHI